MKNYQSKISEIISKINKMKILTNRISQMTDKILGLEGKIDELEYSDNSRDEIVRKHKKNLRHL